MYPIFYAQKPSVALRFGGIFNHESTARFVSSINDDTHDPDSYLDRCNIIQLDTRKLSKDGDIYVFLDLAYYRKIRIHCQHLSETML
jgi:translation elongation factor P/translation initiation factor 5A